MNRTALIVVITAATLSMLCSCEASERAPKPPGYEHGEAWKA